MGTTIPGLGDIAALRDHVAGVVGRLDPESVPLSDATSAWECLDSIERLARSAKTLMARRAEQSREWQRRGYRTAAEFLAHMAGVSPELARRELDTSRKLRDLPRTQSAACRGELSGPQLDLVAQGAAADRTQEQSLLQTASARSFRELRHAAARARAGGHRAEAAERAIHRRRSLSTWTGPDGTWNLRACGTVADGARIEQALGISTDRRFRAAAKAGHRERREAYRFDALCTIADAALAAERTGGGAGSTHPCADGDGARTAPSRRSGGKDDLPVRYLTEVRVDLLALQRGWADGDELCEIAGVGPISVQSARELLGESLLKLVLTVGTDVRAIVPAGRGWTAAQRLAATWSSPTCVVEGCSSPRLELDHRVGWAQGGATRLDNADPLCRHHHDLKTHKGWVLLAGTGKRAFVPPTDPRHPEQASSRIELADTG